MPGTFEFTLNGQRVQVENVSPNRTLLEFLRDRGFTGAKEGCAEGDCGACSVAVLSRDAEGRAAYRAVNSCLMPVCLVAGREVVSVEGVGFCGADGAWRCVRLWLPMRILHARLHLRDV